MAGVLNQVQLIGPRGPVDGILSEPRPGLESLLAQYNPTMRLLTRSDVRVGDILTRAAERYAVTRIWRVGGYLMAELAKEA
jgi:hypothetical protein